MAGAAPWPATRHVYQKPEQQQQQEEQPQRRRNSSSRRGAETAGAAAAGPTPPLHHRCCCYCCCCWRCLPGPPGCASRRGLGWTRPRLDAACAARFASHWLRHPPKPRGPGCHPPTSAPRLTCSFSLSLPPTHAGRAACHMPHRCAAQQPLLAAAAPPATAPSLPPHARAHPRSRAA